MRINPVNKYLEFFEEIPEEVHKNKTAYRLLFFFISGAPGEVVSRLACRDAIHYSDSANWPHRYSVLVEHNYIKLGEDPNGVGVFLEGTRFDRYEKTTPCNEIECRPMALVSTPAVSQVILEEIPPTPVVDILVLAPVIAKCVEVLPEVDLVDEALNRIKSTLPGRAKATDTAILICNAMAAFNLGVGDIDNIMNGLEFVLKKPRKYWASFKPGPDSNWINDKEYSEAISEMVRQNFVFMVNEVSQEAAIKAQQEDEENFDWTTMSDKRGPR